MRGGQSRRMTKEHLAALLLALAPWPGLAADLGQAQVTLPYAELKALLEARDESKAPARPPLAASVASARYELDLGEEVVSGSATFEVQIFSEEWQVVPLLSSAARLTSVEPATSRVVVRDGFHALLTDAAEKTSVTLRFVLPWTGQAGGNPSLFLKRAEAPVSTLVIGHAPAGREVTVADATKTGDQYRLDAGGPLEVGLVSAEALLAAEAQNDLPRVPMVAAVVDSATSQLRVVPDGSLLCEMRYLVSHKTPVTWSVALPEGSELLSCTVEGEPFAPVDRGEGRLEIDLPTATGKASEIKFVYASRVEPLEPVSGSLELELPLTPWLIHDVQWQIDLPSGYELAALDGNVVAVKAVSNDALHIRVRKELCRNERPAVQIFYRKPIR